MSERPKSLIPDVGQTDAVQVLLDASAMLLTTSNQEAVLSGILDIASKVLEADAYAVWLEIDRRGTWRAVASRGLSPSYRTQIHARASDTPTAILAIEDTRSEPVLRRFQEIYEAEGVRSMLVVPLALEDKRSGTITFYWFCPRRFSPLDLAYAKALGNLSAAALNHSALYNQNKHERRRLSFLAEASAVLASSLDYETTLDQVARLAVPHIADWCVIHIVEAGIPNQIVVAHADPQMLAMTKDYSRRYPEELNPEHGLGRVLRTGETEVVREITDEMLAEAARDPDHLQTLRSLGMTSSILVPLSSRGGVLGAIRLLAAGSGRYFTGDDVQLAEDLARRAAAAIENAQLHRALLQRESELRLAHSAARMGSWSWDLIKDQISWSDEFKLLHDLPPDASPAFHGGSELIHPEDRERVLRELQSVLASDAGEVDFEHRAITPLGRLLWVQSRGTIRRNAEGKPQWMVGISMDVTKSRLAEDALRRTEKLAAAGRLAATVAHEVNNPLESLTNLIFLVLNMQDLPPAARAYLDIADGELRRMAQVVRQTLGFYRESTVPAPVDAGTLVAEIADLYRSRASQRSVHLTYSVEPRAMVLANSGEMKQVLANIVANAIDATEGRGGVELSVRRQGSNIEMVVSDQGTGISQSNMARLFEPFFTTKSEVGTGLGLWVSRGIVEKHGGRISITSQTTTGQSGTQVTICLPAFQGADAGG